MVFYTIKITGSDDEIQAIVEAIAETDENFEGDETDSEYDFMEDGNEELQKDDMESIAIDMANAAPNASFTIKGEEENHGYLMTFELNFKGGTLEEKHSDWYVSHLCNRFNYKSYEDFCDSTDLSDKVSEEQFNSLIENESVIAVLDSGNGEVVLLKDIPLFANKIEWEEEDGDEDDEE